MANKNENSTRFYSDAQEKKVVKILGGYQTSNSGAGHFQKCDVIVKDCSLGIECKTSTTQKSSISIKEDWLLKNKEECLSQRLYNSALAFDFGPESKSCYFVIDEKLMRFLIEKLKEDI